MRRLSIALLVACAAGFLPGLADATPPRHVVNAVADGGQARILVRWSQLDGDALRHRAFDVLRRTADETAFLALNDEPITPLATAAEIVAAFTAPGRGDALLSIVETLGDDYANRLLELQSPAAEGSALIQARLLPDQNYGAAIALGVGFMDESVVPGTTYVYEVWGVDARGVRLERLGTASATASILRPLRAVASLNCVDPGDVRADMAAFLRFEPAAAAADDRVVGYDVLRALRNPDGTCPPIARGLPGVNAVNRFPVNGQASGDTARGATLFAASCTSCHAGGRDTAPVAGSTSVQAQRRLFPALWASSVEAAHDTADLHALSPEDWDAIYAHVSEFQFRDDGRHAPDQPLLAGQRYCYQVVPRDLLGQHGEAAPAAPVCEIRDRKPPGAPQGLRIERLVQSATHEACQISWERNAAGKEDTEKYIVLRVSDDAPRREHEVPGQPHAEIPQPASGERVTYLDTTQTQGDAGRAFFYGVLAKDTSGNVSPVTGWIPCTPRDLVAPAAPVIAHQCPSPTRCASCKNWGTDPKWINAGGAPEYWILEEDDECTPELTATAGGDPFLYQPFTSYDGGAFLPGPEQTSPLSVGEIPRFDQVLEVRVKAVDKSGNISAVSNTIQWMQEGPLLPAPQIVSVVKQSGNLVKIKFRALGPTVLLGFALYAVSNPSGDVGNVDDKKLVAIQHPNNFGLRVSDRWAVKAGATRLNNLINMSCSDLSPGETLCYNPSEDVYILQATLLDQDDITLRLHALGWTGREGEVLPYRWDGFEAGNGELEWPVFRAENGPVFDEYADLTLTQLTGPLRVQLSWLANPDGCLDGEPFVVFRRRGNGPWAQLSQPFICDLSLPQPEYLEFIDADVQGGFSYAYRVVRFKDGEFGLRYGPASIAIP